MNSLKTGLFYTRRSFGFGLRHPTVVGIALGELLVAVAALGALGWVVGFEIPAQLTGWYVLAFFLTYLGISLATTLCNAVVVGYVFAVEMSAPRPLKRALRQTRRCLPDLLAFALLSATVLSVLRLAVAALDELGVLDADALGSAVAERSVVVAWALATALMVPVLLFERPASLRAGVTRSATLFGKSVREFSVGALIWPLTYAVLAVGFGLSLLAGNLAIVVVAAVVSVVARKMAKAVFGAYLYGEVAGPFSAGQ